MKKMRTLEISVGFFVIFSVISLLILALQVSGLSNCYESSAGYKVKAKFLNIGGLKPRGKVVMAGVMIGRVVDIYLDQASYEAIVTLRFHDSVRNIPDDSKASILTAGLLGDNYIGLSAGFSDTYFKEGDMITINNTDSAVVLEDLLSKFATTKKDE